MDVIQAVPPQASARPAPPRQRWRSRELFADFLRHPVQTFRSTLEELPYDYPPGVIVSADIAILVIGIASIGQRLSYFPTLLPILALFIAFISVPLFCLFAVVPHPFTLALSGMVATGLFLLQPAPADFAPFLLVVVVGEISAIAKKRVSFPIALLAIAELVVFDLNGYLHWGAEGAHQGFPMYCIGVLLGWMVGVMMQYQRRYLYQEREYQDIRAARAAEEERRRIAREVHDVIAHSLSVTLLHLTAARRALQTDRDVDEAVDALTDAERLGRQAMADIRRTVGLLGAGPAKPAPEPGLSDFDELIGDFVNAGLDVRYQHRGDVDAVSPAVGLALYRIGQESLANVVKHAPGAPVTVRLDVDSRTVRLSVANTLPVEPPGNSGQGMGLSGMRQRAELLGGQFTAGQDRDAWSVRVHFPLTPIRPGFPCAVLNSMGTARTVEGW